MLENIPAILRTLPQWVAAGADKIPVNPRTGQRADPSNPTSGGTFAEAVSCGMKHIGFILGHDDPFTVIDLDDPFEKIAAGQKVKIARGDNDYESAVERAARHSQIYKTFDTYCELSQSGNGVHLVMLGKIPCGVRRDKVEIYSDQRYIIFTGNVIRNSGVNDCQELLDAMFSQMGKMVRDDGNLIEEDPLKEDCEIWSMATAAGNSAKFIALCDGTWKTSQNYPSQSEADYALLSMLAFYSRSNEQVRRMFRATPLGKRTKSSKNDVYINRSLKRIRLKEPPLVSISNLPQIADLKHEDEEIETLTENPQPSSITFPPGLVGEIANYVMSSSIRPVAEVALGAAMALTAGICARSYNISGNGLNQYIMILARTGRGKEGAATGIDNLVAAVRQNIPMADNFLGPAAFASGQALIKVLDARPCFVSVLGEFGLTLQQICEPNAPGPLVMLKKVLLDLYSKSGHSKILRATAYSDSEKNTRIVQAPNVTILGESNPDRFFESLDSSHISEGLLPRFTVLEYRGHRVAKNPNAFHPPEEELVKKLSQLISIAVTTSQNHTCAPVSISPGAKVIFDKFDKSADDRINNSTNDTDSELWNRADLKALKMGALIAVGIDPHNPNITPEVAQWAVDLVHCEISNMAKRFAKDEVGNGEGKQEAEIRRLFVHFQTISKAQRKTHRCPEQLIGSMVCPANFLSIYARRLACFKTDRRGAAKSLADCLADMVRREILEMIPLSQLQSEYKTRTAIYYPGPAWE